MKPTFAHAALLALGTVALPGCASLPKEIAALPAAEAPRFDALQFFAGRSQGQGQLSKVFSGTVPVRVQSRGEMGTAPAERGVLTLLQQVTEGEKPVRTRAWTLREVAPGRYAGTLTDAVGPVEGFSEGNQLTLRYAMKDGFQVEQVLTLSDDGQRAYNVLKVRKWGVVVAVLAEDIVRVE